MTNVFTADFDTGTVGATLTPADSGYGTVTGTITYDNTAFMTGGQSAKFTPGTAAWTLKETFAGGAVTHRFFRRYFRISAYPNSASGMTLCRVRVSSTTTAQIVMGTDGKLSIKNGNTTIVGTTTSAPPLNSWFRVGWEIDGTVNAVQNLNVFYGSNVNGTTATETKTGSYTGGSFDKIEDGVGTAQATGYAGTLWLDGAADDDTALPGPAAGANQPPTANAGSNQTVPTSSTVTLDGSGSSDPDGNVAAWAWTQTGGGAVALSSTSAQKPTFTAPATATTLTFSLTVTDNGGATSSAATVTVTTFVPAAPTFTEDFENVAASNGAVLTTANTGFGTVNGTTTTFDNTDKINGTYSAKAVSDGSAALTLRENLATAVSTRYLRAYFKLSAWGPASAPLTLIRTRLSTAGSATAGHIAVLSTGQVIMRDGQNTTVWTSATTVPLGKWLRVEWAITGTTQTVQIYTDTNVQGSTPTETGTGAFTTEPTFDRIEYGVGVTGWGAVGAANTLWIDAVADATAGWVGPSTGVNLAPVANAGNDQLQLLPNIVVTLDGSGSYDQDGTIATYAWTQTAGPTVALSSTSAVSPTLTTPALAAGASLTYQLVVTDNAGAVSTPDPVTVTVLPCNEFAARGGAWTPASESLL